MYPISDAVKALFEAEQTKVLRITGSTVKILPTDISVYSGDTLVYQSGDSKRVKLYSGTTEVFDSDGTQTIILYSGDAPIYINDEAGMPVNLTITSDDVKANTFVIDRYSCNGQKLEIGTAVASQMKLRLDNRDGFYDGIVLEGVEFFVEIGIADWTQENPTVTYIPCGYFTSCVQPRKLSTIELTCLDRMTRFDKEVNATALSFPATVANLIGQVCTICSMPFNQSLTALPNYNYSITALPTIDGATITYRNLIQWCAGLMGTNAYVDWDGYLQFAWYTNSTGYVSTIDNRYNSDLYENAITITGVEYTDSDEARTVYLAGTDDYALDVSNNGFINANNAATLLAGIYSAVQSFVYTPFTASVIAAPYLWPMDRMTFTDKTGHTHISLLTNVNFGLNGTTGLQAIGETEELNNNIINSGFTAQQLQELKNIKRITSDNLKSAVEEATALITGADGGYVRFVYDQSGKMTEILIMDTDDITTATKVWRWNQGGLGYSANGYAGPYTTAITQNGAIVANFITSGTLDASLATIINLNANNITAGTLSADRINLNSYDPDFLIPDENDSSTLFPNQSISNGWIVQTGGSIDVVNITNAENYRGHTIEISATSIDRVLSGGITWHTESNPGQLMPDEHTSVWYAPTYGATSSDGTLTGATMEGGYYKYTRKVTIPNDAVDAYTVTFDCSGVKAITVSTGVSSALNLRYAENISIDNTGLQVGKFVVNRSGDATFNGDAVFNGNISGTSSSITTPANIATAATDFSISSASFAQWGAVAMVYVNVKRTGTSIINDTTMTCFTMVSGKLPKVSANTNVASETIQYAWMNVLGEAKAYGTWSQNAEKSFYITYILA